MSSSESDENDMTIGQRSGRSAASAAAAAAASRLYSQSKAGPSQQSNDRHELSDNDDDEDHYVRFREEDIIDVDDAITLQLATLKFEQCRNFPPTDRDDNSLRRLHEKIFEIITKETDDSRRRKLKRALPTSNCVREQVYYLRRRPTSPSPSYFHRLSAALDAIVKDSFEEEFRKVATVLGLVEALAETLILEVSAFGMPQAHHNEHRSIRKLIANALTNLTYGQIHSKRRLCSYDGFIDCVVRIIIESPNVTQVYAGLVRNLSWMADGEMSEALRPTVHALAIAAVIANKNRDDGCVKATLSALWNLASHSVENKRTICETTNCLAVLATLLSTDARQTAIVDSATGILKYVSQYLANTSTHLELRSILLSRLVSLLGSSSFTIVTNTLGAIANLISKDPHLQNALRHDANAVQQLNVLRNSNREDIRSAVKNVLNAVNQPTGHTRFGEMSCSMGATAATLIGSGGGGGGGEPMMHSHHHMSSPRLLPLRATRASPGRFLPHPHHHQQQHQHQQHLDQRSCSLPRHFIQQNGGMNGFSMAHSYHQNIETNQPTVNENHQQRQLVEEEEEEEEELRNIDDGLVEVQSETAMGTRSNSARSLGSVDPGSVMNTGGWNSTIDTAANSSRALSPISFSEIPASPTMCGQIFNFGANQEKEQKSSSNYSSEQQTPVFNQQLMINSSMPFYAPQQNSTTSSSTYNPTKFSGGSSANTMKRNCGESSIEATTTMLDSQLVTLTFLNVNGIVENKKNEEEEEGEEEDDDVLPGPSLEEEEEEEDDEDYAIIGAGNRKNSLNDEDLLMKSIQAEKPAKVSPRLNGFFSPPISGGSRNGSWSMSRNQSDSDRLLMECILSEMPQTSLSPAPNQIGGGGVGGGEMSLSKNEEADRRDAIIASHEPSDQYGGLNIVRNSNAMGSTEKPNGLARMESLESQASSEDSFGVTTENSQQTMMAERRFDGDSEMVDTSIPADCYEDDYDYTDDEDYDETQFDEGIIDQHMTIDCSIISTGSSTYSLKHQNGDSKALATSTPKGSSSTIPMLRSATKVSTQAAVGNRKSRLPVPKTNGSLVDKIINKSTIPPSRPRLPPKPITMKVSSSKSYLNEVENDIKDDTIYVNAPIVEEKQQRIEEGRGGGGGGEGEERIYMNTTRKSDDSSSIGSVSSSTKSAIVQPYNYQKPFITRSNGEMSNEKPNTKQMLVTTV